MNQWLPPEIVGYCTPDASNPPHPVFEQLSISMLRQAQAGQAAGQWVLMQTADRLCLLRPDGVELCIDMTAGKARHRAGEAGHGAQSLAKALGLKTFRKRHARLPSVTDATGGLGQDAWAIASLGCQVTIMEQHPVIHALLDNALTRAGADPLTTDTAGRLTLLSGDASGLLTRQCSDVLYLDPMYPARERKRADSKKGMQFLHALLGPPSADASAILLRTALACEATRVVVKRPKGAALLEGSDTFSGQRTSIESPNTRYDVYHQRGAN